MSCAAPSIVGFARTPTRRIMTSATSTVPKGAPASTAKGGEGWTQRVLTLSPKQRGIFIWTDSLRRNVPEISSCQAGVLNLFLRSTTAALSVNENADPDVRTDLENALDRIVPGTESLDAVARSSFVGVSMDVPVQGGKLAFGTWQGLYLCEWGDGSAPIEVVATLVDNSADVKCTRNVTVKAPARGCHLVQDDVDDALAPARGRLSGTKPGLVNLLIRHTSASLTMNENADPTVRGDMEAALNRIVPERWHDDLFAHVEEGPDDMTAHVKSTLFGSSLTVPVDANGRMRTGTWQGVYLCEHRNIGGMGVGHAREIATAMLDGSGAANTAGQGTVTLTAPGRGCHDFTADIAAAAEGIGMGSKVRTGWLNLFCQHTSASLTVTDRSTGSRRRRSSRKGAQRHGSRIMERRVLRSHVRGPGRHARARQGVHHGSVHHGTDRERGVGFGFAARIVFVRAPEYGGFRVQPQPRGCADASGRRSVMRPMDGRCD